MPGTVKGYYRLSVISIAVMLLVIGLAEYQYNQKAVDAAQWVSHTHQVLDNLESIRTIYAGSSSAFHSAPSSVHPKSSGDYENLKARLDQKISELIILLRDNPDQTRRAEHLRAIINLRVDTSAANRAVPNYKFEYLEQQNILNLIAEIRSDEIILLGERENRNKEYIALTNKIFAVAVAFGLLITFFFHIILDYSERKRSLAEQKVRRDRDYFESIFKSLREPVLILNEQFVIQALNQAYLDHFRCTYSEIVGQQLKVVNSGIWNTDELLEKLRSIFLNETELLDYEYAAMGGSHVPIQFSLGAQIVSASEDEKKQLILTIVDLTEKKKAEMEREHFFRLSPEMLAVIDRNGTLLSTNPAWQRVLGYSETDLVGQSLVDFLHPDDRSAFVQLLADAESDIRAMNIENRLLAKSGNVRWFNWNCFFSSPESEILIAAHDLTDVKLTTLQLEEFAAVNVDLYENAPCGYYELDIEGKIVRSNNTFAAMLGYSKEELLGNSIYTFITEYVNNGKSFKQRLAEVVTGDAYQANFKKKNGEHLFSHITVLHLFNCSGDLSGMRATVQDVTELKKAKVEVEQYLAELQDLYNNAPCGYHSLDKDGVFVQVNDTELTWFGYSREEMVHKKKFTELVTQESAQIFVANFPSFIKNGYVNDLVFECVRADGSHFKVLLSATAVKDSSGAYLFSRTTMFDITEREVMREAHGKLAAIVASAADSIIGLSLQGEILSCNAATEQLYGLPAHELIGKPYTVLIPESLFSQTELFLRQVADGSDVQAVETLRRNTANRLFYVSLTLSKVVDGNGRVVGAAAFEHDISDKIAAANELRMLNESLRQRENSLLEVNKELEAFSYSVSHDLRAPLRHIDGFVDMLKKAESEKLSPEGSRYLGIIADSARQMGKLIDDLLSFSRIGRAGITMQSVNLEHMVRDVFAEYAAEVTARKIDIKIMPLPDVYADPSLLRLVWTNLISNAIKYTRKQLYPVINIEHAVSGNEHTFTVSDNGAGFDNKYIDKLFGVFQRLHRADEFEGTGIGLANVRRIVLRHSGRVWANGIVNEGAAFSFTLPITPEAVSTSKSEK